MRVELLILCSCLPYLAIADEKSIAFVIDTTGSMSSDIQGAISGSTQIFRTMTSQDSDIKNFILAPFNDPGYGPTTDTTSQSTFLAALNNLKATGGDDCPELAMHGLQLAINAIYPRSTIFVFTDASAKDYSLESTILNLIQAKQCQVIHYIEAHYNEVSLESLDFTSAPNQNTEFQIDSHLVGFSISVSGTNIRLNLYNPAGAQVRDYWSVVNLANAKVISVNGSSFSFGKWKVNTQISGAYSMRITGIGFMEYGYGFSQHSDSPSPDYRPLVGVPSYILGKLSNMSRPGRATSLDLVSLDGSLLKSATLSYRSGYEYQYVAGPVVTPTNLFRMKIKGTDEHGKAFQRITSTAVSAESNPCVIIDCNGHGTCNRLSGTNYTCTCNTGYNGPDCYYRDACTLDDPCEHGGTCVQNGNDYTCACTLEYMGTNCAQGNPCGTHDCNGHGTCTALNATDYACTCQSGYNGNDCKYRDACILSPPCANGGTCTQNGNDYSCTCPTKYTGKNCSEEAACSGQGTPSCSCFRGYTGENCESEVDWCDESVDGMMTGTKYGDLCSHGNCSSAPDGASCVCQEGFTGEFCDQAVNTVSQIIWTAIT